MPLQPSISEIKASLNEIATQIEDAERILAIICSDNPGSITDDEFNRFAQYAEIPTLIAELRADVERMPADADPYGTWPNQIRELSERNENMRLVIAHKLVKGKIFTEFPGAFVHHKMTKIEPDSYNDHLIILDLDAQFERDRIKILDMKVSKNEIDNIYRLSKNMTPAFFRTIDQIAKELNQATASTPPDQKPSPKPGSK